MRRTIVAAMTALLLIASAPPSQAAQVGNIYNGSDHGMWFAIAKPVSTSPLKWVPAKRWSRDVGVMATGVYTGQGYCIRLYTDPYAWRERYSFPGPRRVATDIYIEWMVKEYPC